MSMYVGEALCGEGNEVAHIDLLIGDKDGPVGVAFANALSRQSAGHSNLLAVLTANLAVKPSTVMITKVTIKGAKQAVHMFGPAQYAVAKAVADSVEKGVIPKDKPRSWSSSAVCSFTGRPTTTRKSSNTTTMPHCWRLLAR